MDYRLFLIPVGMVIVAVIVLIFLSKKGQEHTVHAQADMKNYALEEIPGLKGTYFDVVQLLENAVNVQHFWVVAYNKEGMWLIPSSLNVLTQVYSRYEDITPAFNLKKQIAAHMFVGNRSENIDYVPFSAVSKALVDESKRKIEVSVGGEEKSFKYATNGYGEEQLAALRRFLDTLKGLELPCVR